MRHQRHDDRHEEGKAEEADDRRGEPQQEGAADHRRLAAGEDQREARYRRERAEGHDEVRDLAGSDAAGRSGTRACRSPARPGCRRADVDARSIRQAQHDRAEHDERSERQVDAGGHDDEGLADAEDDQDARTPPAAPECSPTIRNTGCRTPNTTTSAIRPTAEAQSAQNAGEARFATQEGWRTSSVRRDTVSGVRSEDVILSADHAADRGSRRRAAGNS